MNTKRENNIVCKHNDIVAATYSLTLGEQRLLIAAMSQINSFPGAEPLTEKTGIEVSAEYFGQLFDLPQGERYTRLTEAVDRLYLRSLVIDKPDPSIPMSKYTATRWVATVSYQKDSGKAWIFFTAKIIPFLTQLNQEFVKYQVQHVSPMTSNYSIRIYEMLRQWLPIGQKDIKLDWLKEKLEIVDCYHNIRDFKKRVLDVAVKQINDFSDLSVHYENIKHGRDVIGFRFSFSVKPQVAKVEVKPQPQPTPVKPTHSRNVPLALMTLEELRKKLPR